jgi:ribonuclease HI
VITLNLRGIGAKHATARRERVYEQMGAMAKKYPKHILFFQETRLDGTNHRAIQPIIGLDWLIIYSHLTSASAGVLICIPPSVVAAYHIHQLATSGVLRGHAVAAQLEPRDSHCPTTPSLLLLNIYLSTGENVNALQTAQLAALTKLGGSPLKPAAYTYAAGDFNFTESPADTASGVPSIRSAAHTRAWHGFLARHRLREHYQQVHTFYRITRDLTKSTSTRIDRIYTSHDDVDMAVVTAVAAVTNVTTSILEHLRRVRQADTFPAEGVQPVTAKLDTDHLPVCLSFTTQSSAARLPTIPRWMLVEPHFVRYVRTHWAPELATPEQAFARLDRFKQLLYDAKRSTLALDSSKRKAKHDQLTLLTSAFSLLRAISCHPTNYTRVSKILLQAPELTDTLSGQAQPDGSFAPKRLRGLIEELLKDAQFVDDAFLGEATPWIPPAKPVVSGGLAADLAIILPSCRPKLAGLRTGDLTSDTTTDPTFMADIALQYWGGIWHEHGSRDPEECREYISEDGQAGTGMAIAIPGVQHMVDAIMSTGNTSAGPDGIPFGAYRTFSDLAGPILHEVLLAMAAGQTPPLGYNYALLYLLPKKLTMLIQDTRPISVTNADNRIIARFMVNTIIEPIKARLHLAQKGSIRGYQGQDHVRELTELFYSAVEDETLNYHVLFADTKKAFDSIHHRFIFAALGRIGLPLWVIRVMRGLLDRVAATPVFGAYSGVWISITRGVKQGCPTSPLIFAICIDVLVVRLSRVAHVRVWAYVDDIAIGCTQVRGFSACMTIMDEFSLASGLGLNREKTKIISAKHDPDVDVWLTTRGCPWWQKGIRTALSYVYLGVLMGRLVTVYEVWSTVLTKMATRLARYKPILATLTPYKRIEVYNIFVFPLISYIGPLYTLPTFNRKHAPARISFGRTFITTKGPQAGNASFQGMMKEVRNAIIPFGGTALKYLHYIAPRADGGPVTPMKDLWAGSFTMLASQAVLAQYEGAQRAPPPDKYMRSMRISEHIRQAGADFVNWTCQGCTARGATSTVKFDAVPFTCANRRTARANIYNSLIQNHLAFEHRDSDLHAKLVARGCAGTKTLAATYKNACSKIVPSIGKAVWHAQLLLAFNALATSRRTRFARATVTGLLCVDACYLCGQGHDSQQHLYGSECAIVVKARQEFSTATGYPLSHTALKARNQREAHFLIADAPASALTAMAIFNWAIWLCTRKHFQHTTHYPTPRQATSLIVTTAAKEWMRVRKPAWATPAAHIAHLGPARRMKSYGAAGTRTQAEADAGLAAAHRRLATIPPDDTIIYTDGSAINNPGPSGAGAVIEIQATNTTVEMVAALGEGTNAIGEAWAIGMACQYIATRTLANIHIASDSKTTVDILNMQAGSYENLPILHAARELIMRLRKTRQVYVFWVGGHLGLAGNEAADKLADLGSARTLQGHGMRNRLDFIKYTGKDIEVGRNSHFSINNMYTSISKLTTRDFTVF